MVTWQVMVTAVVAVFAVVGTGAALRRANWLTTEADQTLMALIVRILMPCLIVHTMLGNVHLREIRNVLWPPLIGAGGVLLGFLVAWLWTLTRPSALETAPKQRTFVLTTGLQNYVFIPLPLIELLFPTQREATMGVLFVHNVGTELTMWTVGVLILTGGLGKGWWRRVINPPSVAVVLALLLNFVQLRQIIPDFVMNAMQMLGRCAIPLALLLVGAIVSDQLKGTEWRKGGKKGWEVMGGACLVRLGLVALGLLVLAKVLPVSIELKHVLVLQAAMPAGMFPIVMAKYYGGDPPTAVRVVGATSILGLLTIPLWVSLGLWWVG